MADVTHVRRGTSFIWDDGKDAANQHRHGMAFRVAVEAFFDPFARVVDASRHQQNRDKLDMIARLLLERETLDGRDIEEIAKFGRLLKDADRVPANDTPAEGLPKPEGAEGAQAVATAAPIV